MKIFGSILVMAAFAVIGGCAKADWIERTLVTVDVTGTWEGSSTRGAKYQFNLEQSGAAVKGSAHRWVGAGYLPVFASRPIEGTVSGDLFSFKNPGSVFGGQLRVSGDEMSGDIDDAFGRSLVTLRRTNPSSLPAKQ